MTTLTTFDPRLRAETEAQFRSLVGVQAQAMAIASDLHRLVGHLDAIISAGGEMPPVASIAGVLGEAQRHTAGALRLVAGGE